jgi:hypothetical protein
VSKRITMADALEPVEVDLFGFDYEMKPATRSLVAECRPYEQKLEDADEGDADALIAAVGALLDIRLKSANGNQRKKPSAIVKEKWEADQLTTSALMGFLADLSGAQFARPT